MKKDIIILIFVTCVLGGLNVSFNYHNWSKPQLDTSCISNATPDINDIDIEGVRLFSLYTNFFESFGLDYNINIEASTTESIDLNSLDEKSEGEEETTSAIVAEIPEVIPPPPPPPPPPITVIEIVDEEGEIEEELDIENIDVDTEIEIVEEYDVDDTPFRTVENMPALGPCKSMRGDERNQCTQMEIIKYISENVEYPPIAKDAGIQGTVFVYFVVGKDGYVKDVNVLRGVDSRLDKEAKRVVSSLPKFEPGTQIGKNVSVEYTIPINFKFDGYRSTKSKNTKETPIEVEEVEEVKEDVVEPKNEKKRRGKKDRKKKKKK